MEISKDYWRKCSTCKKNLSYEAKYYECSVSTCSRKRSGYVFCSVSCWDSHVPGAGHRDAGAIEKRSPSYQQWLAEVGNESSPNAPKRILISNSQPTNSTVKVSSSAMTNEVLIVVSKVKQYIKDCSDMNTAGDVNEVLSEMIRRTCDQAMQNARADGRKTVMARDFKNSK